MPFTFLPHETVEDPHTRLIEVRQPHNYICLMTEHQRYYLQDGLLYEGSGGSTLPLSTAPTWVREQYAALSTSARRAVGFETPPSPLTDQFSTLQPEVQERLMALIADKAPRMPDKAPQISDQYEDEDPEDDGLPDDPEPFEVPSPHYWTCEECQEFVKLSHKGLHIARHRRAAKAKH